jgi:uncharacterized cupin superfamily protein
MQRTDSYAIAHSDELERTGNWRLVRRSLGCGAFGVNLVEIMPGESLPEHDETERDQEELFFVLAGDPTLMIDGVEHVIPTGTFARVDPQHRRTVRNDGVQAASVLIVSAPRSSGYEPMEWA